MQPDREELLKRVSEAVRQAGELLEKGGTA